MSERDLAAAHQPDISDAPFPWFVRCTCGWVSNRTGSTADARMKAREHLIKVGQEEAQ